MLTEKGVKRVLKELRELTRIPARERGFGIYHDESDLQTFYSIVRSMEGDYQDGEYIFRIKLPDEYPFKPPVICCETPNGRFLAGQNICLSISHFHSETWSPLITLEKIILSVVSVFYDETISGVGSIRSTPAETREAARRSIDFNKKHFPHVLKNEL